MTGMSGNAPLVSVIVPCYNIAPFVAETIRSVIAQTYQHWELILIDDGSKDNLAEAVQPFLKDARIQFHVRKNQGVSAARNNGIALAKGDFIAFLDSDDVWLPEKLHRQLEIFHTYPDVGICGTGYVEIDRASQIGTQVADRQDFHGQASVPLVSGVLSIPLSSGIVRKNVCERIKSEQGYLFDESITSLSEDFDFWLRCSAYVPFYKIGEPLVQYRVRPGNATSVIWLKRQNTVLNEIIPKFCNRYGSFKYIQPRHIRQLKSFFYHERGSSPGTTTRRVKTYWFIRSLLCNPRNRDAWGALGHQLLPEPIYQWIKKLVGR